MRKSLFILLLVFLFSLIPKNNNIYAVEQHNGKLGRHSRFVYTAVKKRLGISDADIKAARQQGRTVFDLAGQKGVSDMELRGYIISEAEKSLEEAYSKGKLPRFVLGRVKNKVRFTIENWDGCIN